MFSISKIPYIWQWLKSAKVIHLILYISFVAVVCIFHNGTKILNTYEPIRANHLDWGISQDKNQVLNQNRSKLRLDVKMN